MITVYKGEMSEENKLVDNVSRYTLDLAEGRLTVFPMLREPQEFKINKNVSWDESNDSMIIDWSFNAAVVSGIKNSLKPIMIIQLFVFIIVVPFLPLLISCRWNWWEAWLYAAVSITGFIVSRFMAEKRNPGLLKERARFTDHDNVKPWDRVLSPLVSLGGSLILLIAGLDELFNWSGSVPLVVKIAALAVILAGYGVGTWALIENRFFSAVVRIQGDRKHSVI
jgi:hypothetical protein